MPGQARILAAGTTDVGRKRTENEDAFVVDPDLGVYVVCDGMGGHASGEVASAMTTEEIHAFFQQREDGDRSLPYQGEPGATAGELVISNAAVVTSPPSAGGTSLSLIHPVTGAALLIPAPPSEDFVAVTHAAGLSG